MSPEHGRSGAAVVRVEQALALLPDLEALLPLRALLVSIARLDERTRWSSSGPYLTLGKRGVDPEELRRSLPQALHRLTEHVAQLYAAYGDALDANQQGDGAAAVRALLRAGRLEEGVGRRAQARVWYETARRVAEALPDRRPEIEVLITSARLALAVRATAEAGREFQRAFTLAEAEFDQPDAIAGCEGLGDVAVAQGGYAGAQAWYARALRLAQATDDGACIGRLERLHAALALRQGDLARAATHVARARERLEAAGAEQELARALVVDGRIQTRLGRQAAAAAALREAMAWAQRGPRDESLDVTIRINLAESLISADRLLEAEEELRRAEQVAISASLTPPLIRVYVLMGRLHGRQQDETGFVFFEQALVLCRALEPSRTLEAALYRDYGLFRADLGQQDEARELLQRARALYDSLGEAHELEQVEAELQRVSV